MLSLFIHTFFPSLFIFFVIYQVLYINYLCADPVQPDGVDNEDDINSHLLHKETNATE